MYSDCLQAQTPAVDGTSPDQERSRYLESCALFGLANVVALYLLYLNRGLDDNRLVSWAWTLNDAVFHQLLLVLVPVMVLLALLVWRFRAVQPSALPLFALSLLACVPLWSVPEVYLDSARYLEQARALAAQGPVAYARDWGQGSGAWTDLPLIPALFGLLWHWFGESRLLVQGLNTAFFAGTVMLVVNIGRTMFDRHTGLMAGLLMLAMPYLLVQTPLLMVDVGSLFFLCLTLNLLLGYLNDGRTSSAVMAVLAGAAALLCKYSLLPVIACLALVLVLPGPAVARFHRLGVWAGGVVLLMAPLLMYKFTTVGAQLALLADYQLPALGGWKESHWSTFFFQMHGLIPLAVLAAVVMLSRREPRTGLLGLVILAVLVTGIERSRYLMVVYPLMALLAARGLALLPGAALGRFAAAMAAATGLALAHLAYAPFLGASSYTNLASAGAYLDTLPAQRVGVVVLPQSRSRVNPCMGLPMLDLHTRQALGHVADAGTVCTEPAGGVTLSPVRFTWDWNPQRHYAPVSLPETLVVIGGGVGQVRAWADQALPAGYRAVRQYFKDEGVFRYRTLLAVYRPATQGAGAGSAHDPLRSP